MCRGCSTKGLHSSVLWAGLLTTVEWTQECGDLTGPALSSVLWNHWAFRHVVYWQAEA